MFAGRVGSWERLQYRVRIEPTMQETDGEGVSGVLTVPFAPDLNTLSEYLKLTLSLTRTGGTTTRTAAVQLGALTWSSTATATATAQELVVEIHEPRWYVSPLIDGAPAWEFRWSDLRVYINGAQVSHTLPASGSVRNDTYFAPAGLPFSLARLHGAVTLGAGIGGTGQSCQAWSLIAEARVRVVGGWRIREQGASDWTAYPIRAVRQSMLGNPCGDTPAPPELGGADTWSATVESYQFMSAVNTFIGEVTCRCPCPHPVTGETVYVQLPAYRQTTTTRERNSSLWIMPDLPRQIVSLGENIPHEYLMYRAKFPRVRVLRTATGVHTQSNCDTGNTTPCNQTLTNPIELHPQRDELLYVHDGGAGNPLNEPTAESLYCPYALGVSETVGVTHFICPSGPVGCPLCPPEWQGSTEPCCYTVTNSTRTHTESHSLEVNDNCHPHYRHATPAVRYISTHGAPYWSYISWMQDWLLDRNGDGTPEPTPVADYWRPHQCQHIDHPSLPTPIRTKRRSYLLLDTLAHGTWSAWINALFAVPSGWVGSSRPALVDWLGVSERALAQASQPRWSAQNAVLVFSPLGVTVTPTSTTHTVEFTLADWNAEPYLYPAVADRVRVWLPDTAYTAIAIQLVSAENESVTIAATRGTHAIPHSDDTKYAGTWRRQYAAAAAGYSELGWDWDTDGVSQATFADAKRALLWQLLGARAGAKLRITITQTAPTPYTLDYPLFYRDAIQHAFATDNGAQTYPHIRNAQTLNWGLLTYPIADNAPSVRPPHQPMTLYDAAALYRQLERAESASDTITIINQIRDWGFDDAETGGHPAGVVRVRQMCRAAMLPYTQRLALWLISDLRECPPLPTLPTRKYRNTPFGFTGDWGQWVYFCAPSHRYYLAPTEPAKLMEAQGANETELTSYDRAVGRYHLTRQAIALDGTETLQHATKQWRIRVASRDLAYITPFFSHALVPPRIEKIGAGGRIVIDTRRQYLHFAAGETLYTYHLQPFTLLLQQDYTGIIVGLERDSRQDTLLIAVQQAGTIHLYRSHDNGYTAVQVLQVNTQGLVVVAVSPLGLWVVFYRAASGQIMRRASYTGGDSWDTPIAIQVGNNPVDGIPLDAYYDARAHSIFLVYVNNTDQRIVLRSNDAGETFTVVLP